MNTARYLEQKLNSVGFACRLNDLSCTVILERPLDDKFIKRWQLACEEDIAHVVVMPNITEEKIDQFVEELIDCRKKNGRMKPRRPDSPLTKLSCSSLGKFIDRIAQCYNDRCIVLFNFCTILLSSFDIYFI